MKNHKKKEYSFLKTLTIMNEMQEKIKNKVDVYTNNLLIANAFYNITHFGTARDFYEGEIVGYGHTPYSFEAENRKMITDCTLAKKYYQAAFEAATNDEQRAKCQYLLSKCERNNYYNNKYFNVVTNYWEQESDGIDFLAWNGFKKLQKDYSKTNYYQEVIAECGYFNTYVNSK